ncbi:MAG TPA: hypothetical protein PL033_06200 [Candidatus Brocadiia bacterium]|nr:hypothetical protein [Candidatus Brocadiia bacterium]
MGKPVWGMVELLSWLADNPDPTGREIEDCLRAHLERGISNIVWSAARSAVGYWTELPGATRATQNGAQTDNPEFAAFTRVMRERCPLNTALEYSRANGMTLYARICVNHHYSSGHPFRSAFAESNPQWHCATKDGAADPARMCFFFPEVRAERVAIVREIALMGVNGVMLDFCRTPPILQYQASLRKAYRNEASVDPAELSPKNRKAFLPWALFRTEFATQFLRDARTALNEASARIRRKIALQVRVPDLGIDANLLGGVNIVRWLSEGLIDELVLDPMEWIENYHTHDPDVYIDLCKDRAITIHGGVSGVPVDGFEFNPLPVARRAKSLLDYGVDGVHVFGSESAARNPDMGWLLPDIGDSAALGQILSDRSLKKKYPVTWTNGNSGFDNMSSLPGFGWDNGERAL